MRTLSRRDFLQWSAAGAGLLLSGCTFVRVPEALPELVLRDDPRYATLRHGYNTRVDRHPHAIALCRDTAEVAAAIRYARRLDLPVAVRSGGHSMEGFSSNDDGLVIDLSRINQVQLQADGSAQVGPGCKLAALYDALLPQGRLLPAGSCGSVGIGGLTLGGGYGFFSRRYGLTCDHLRAATMVDGRGEIRSTRDDTELLWALRGGGAGNFGVVTAMEFETRPVPELFHSHRFRVHRLGAVDAAAWFERWFAFAAQLPETAFSACLLNGRTLYVLITNIAGDDAEVATLSATLAQGTEPVESDHRADIGNALKRYYGSLAPLPFKNASAGFYRSFADIEGVIEPILRTVIETPGLIYQINTVGGRIDDPARSAVSCYPHRRFGFISELQAYWQRPEQQADLMQVSTQIQERIRAAGIQAQYVNYCSRDFPQWWLAYYGDNYARLQAVKRHYDPDDCIRYPQSVRG